MQNRYTGDIGDFAKYGLLRALAGTGDQALRLGVNWYLTLDEGHTGDGGQVRYLLPGNEHPYVDCDEPLYGALRTVVMSGARSVAAVRTHQLLPPRTVFYESVLAPLGVSGQQFAGVRRDWHEQALIATAPCDLVFLDPDNGVALDIAGPGIKHALVSEAQDYRERGQGLVVYHQFGRSGTHVEQMRRIAAHLQRELPGPGPILLRAGRGSPRAFVVLPSEHHETLVRARVDEFLAGPWSAVFEQGPG